MVVFLPRDKVSLIIEDCRKLTDKKVASIREVAHVIGLLVSTFSAVEFGPLYYRELEKEKILALKRSKGDFEAKMSVTHAMQKDLRWWIDHLQSQERKIAHGNPSQVITTDASLSGWGAQCVEQKAGGRWKLSEMGHHINYLELLAIFHGLRSFCRSVSAGSHVRVQTDNKSALAYVNSMGGVKSPEMNDLARQIWQWCISCGIWLSASYIPGSLNCADFESRHYNENVEWKLDSDILQKIFDPGLHLT